MDITLLAYQNYYADVCVTDYLAIYGQQASKSGVCNM